MLNDTIQITETIEAPVLGFGTWQMSDEQAEKAVQAALDLGYRHIDTAQIYKNEEGVGKGIQNSSVPREEIFLTTKIADTIKDYDGTLASIDESLRKLGTDYIGLLLIHSPRPFAEMFEPTGKTWNEENVQVCKAMEDAMKSGKVRAIGLCNFQIEDIGNILANSDVKPAMNQVLVNITHYPEKLIQYCQEHGIVVGAYSPNATGNLKGEQIEAIAKKYGCSIPQIGSRFDVQLGCVVLPKSTNPAHIKENGELDFVISDEDMEILKQIGKYEGWKGAEDKLVKR